MYARAELNIAYSRLALCAWLWSVRGARNLEENGEKLRKSDAARVTRAVAAGEAVPRLPDLWTWLES